MRVICWIVTALLAVPALAQSFNGRSATEWVDALADDDPTTRDYAVWALVTMGDRAVRATTRALGDERPRVRQHAAQALGRIGAPAASATARLVALQQDAAPDVRRAAEVAAMRVQVDAARLPHLIAALQGGDWELQLAAAEVVAALGPAGKSAAGPLVDLLRRDDPALDRTVVQRLPRAPTLHWNVREAVARALGAIGPVEGVPIVPALRDAMWNREWAAREGAVRALASFPADEESVTRALAMLVGDEAWSCRRAAAEAVAALVPSDSPWLGRAVPVAILALRDDDGGVRRLAAEFLGGLGAAAADAVPAFASMLGSRRANDRDYAIKALGRLGPVAVAARQALIDCYEAVPTDEPWRQQEVLEALAAVAPDARRELPALATLLDERERPAAPADVQRQQAIAEALAGLQDGSIDQRRRALGQVAELRAVEAIPHLLPWLDEGSDPARGVGERAAAAQILMLLDAASAVPAFRTLLGDGDRALRAVAARALAMFDDAESRPRVAAVLAEEIAVANKDQLVYLGLTGVADLAPALEDIVRDPEQPPRRRWGAIAALGSLEAKQAAATIAAMLERVGADESMPARERDELLAIGLQVLARLDAVPHRQAFERFAASDETQVREAALLGLARLGDAAALAEVRSKSPWVVLDLDVPAELRPRLLGTRLRLSEVRGNTLRDVLARLEQALGMPIELGGAADPRLLDGRFRGLYIDLLGLRPQALAVLGVIHHDFFSGGTLRPRFHADRIELLPPEAAGLGGRR